MCFREVGAHSLGGSSGGLNFMGSIWLWGDCRKIPGGKSCPIRVCLKTVTYNVRLNLFYLFLGDIEGLTEPSGQQAGGAAVRGGVRSWGVTDEGSQMGMKATLTGKTLCMLCRALRDKNVESIAQKLRCSFYISSKYKRNMETPHLQTGHFQLR